MTKVLDQNCLCSLFKFLSNLFLAFNNLLMMMLLDLFEILLNYERVVYNFHLFFNHGVNTAKLLIIKFPEIDELTVISEIPSVCAAFISQIQFLDLPH